MIEEGTLAASPIAAPPQRRPLLQALVRFVATGGASVGIDVAVLAVLHGAFHVHLFIATSIAYFSSLAVNYSLNHAWVFQAQGSVSRRLVRYGSLVAVNYLSTVVIVTSLSAAGLFYLVAKSVAVGVNAVLNFFSFRYWVFR
jgi:putative flippase GtrA